VVLTGAGSKAFVSGADIHALAAVQKPQDGYDLAKLGQDVGALIARSSKPVVAALNGLAFGGGLELALACHARLAVSGHKALVGLPEVNLGILPGAGGTQRLARLMGLQAAARLIRTGASLSSDEALAGGVVRGLYAADQLVEAAVALVADVAGGKVSLPAMADGPLADDTVGDADIGHRSRAVDAIVCRVLQHGARHGLAAGLQAELDGFAEVCALQDMRIGVQHFLQQGPRTPAPFVHG
jgi:enoyl-CoA hydratase/carnithine racemase